MLKNAAILLRPNLSKSKSGFIKQIYDFLGEKSISFRTTENTAEFFGAKEKIDLMIVLGGDGMMLEAARFCAPRNIPVIGLNFGGKGFLTAERDPNNFVKALERILRDDYHIEKRILAQATVFRNGKKIGRKIALNDIQITENNHKMVKLNFSIEDGFFKTAYSDGLLVSTPTGSTGYTLYVGPILGPEINCLLVRTIHNQGSPILPICVEPKSLVRIKIIYSKGKNIVLMADGQEYFPLKLKDMVEIKKFAKPVKLIRFSQNYFWEALNGFLR